MQMKIGGERGHRVHHAIENGALNSRRGLHDQRGFGGHGDDLHLHRILIFLRFVVDRVEALLLLLHATPSLLPE